jgi:hypothetical protein
LRRGGLSTLSRVFHAAPAPRFPPTPRPWPEQVPEALLRVVVRCGAVVSECVVLSIPALIGWRAVLILDIALVFGCVVLVFGVLVFVVFVVEFVLALLVVSVLVLQGVVVFVGRLLVIEGIGLVFVLLLAQIVVVVVGRVAVFTVVGPDVFVVGRRFFVGGATIAEINILECNVDVEPLRSQNDVPGDVGNFNRQRIAHDVAAFWCRRLGWLCRARKSCGLPIRRALLAGWPTGPGEAFAHDL